MASCHNLKLWWVAIIWDYITPPTWPTIGKSAGCCIAIYSKDHIREKSGWKYFAEQNKLLHSKSLQNDLRIKIYFSFLIFRWFPRPDRLFLVRGNRETVVHRLHRSPFLHLHSWKGDSCPPPVTLSPLDYTLIAKNLAQATWLNL